ncbi:hypothetical protein EPN29_13565 [bacterium]|nr:MAG: hypothetical protein EPN29_13565 [bacterium]
MAKRKALGSDPFDAVLPAARPAPVEARVDEASSTGAVRLGIRFDSDLIDEIRDAVVALSGPPHQLTVVGFVNEACRRELARLRNEANRGQPFPHRGSAPRRGRRVSGA